MWNSCYAQIVPDYISHIGTNLSVQNKHYSRIDDTCRINSSCWTKEWLAGSLPLIFKLPFRLVRDTFSQWRYPSHGCLVGLCMYRYHVLDFSSFLFLLSLKHQQYARDPREKECMLPMKFLPLGYNLKEAKSPAYLRIAVLLASYSRITIIEKQGIVSCGQKK